MTSRLPRLGIPKRACGFSLDTALAYETRKTVIIEDRRIGCVYYFLVSLVLLWVVGYQVLWRNEHFQLFDVKGQVQLSLQQPTKGCNPKDNDCEDNFISAIDLPYCKQFTGPKGPNSTIQQNCIFADARELLPQGMLGDTMMIPTRLDGITETRNCRASADNGYHCKKLWTAEDSYTNYVADIEDFTVMVVSTYHRGNFIGNSLNHQGFYYECRDPETHKVLRTDPCEGELRVRPIHCLEAFGKDGCGFKTSRLPPRSRAFLQKKRKGISSHALQAGDESEAEANGSSQTGTDSKRLGHMKKDTFAIPNGDIFKLSKLLELAGLNLDANFNQDGEPLRERGTKLEVLVEYANLRPLQSSFGDMEVGYIYKVVERPMDEMKVEPFRQHQPENFPQTRLRENRHGIHVRGSVSGSFGYFNLIYLLVMLTTSLALLGAASKITDLLATYVPSSFQNDYSAAKFQYVGLQGPTSAADEEK
eukprot:TRINITY_DN51785_c0_g1_i1.p1 TRINITY_DN51785_c0_g1~~TRINITY_DN51785_c0_g1_i1.p1  ORF type:complete len:476 (+),score=59.48 TRINITY_DN51785_c0_g1_i1:79-1506(+)